MFRTPHVAAVLLLAGCAPRPLVPVIAAALHAVPSIDPLPWRVRAALDSAVRGPDDARIVEMFAPDAFVISATGDTVPARAFISIALDELRRDGRTAGFAWARDGNLESCRGGARERLQYTIRLTGSDGATTQLRGNVSVFWTQDSAGAVRVAWIAFAPRERSRQLTKAECPSPRPSPPAYAYHWRWSVSVAPGAEREGNETGSSFEAALSQQGWYGPDCPCFGPGLNYTPLSRRTRLRQPRLVSAQIQVFRHVVLEGVTGRVPAGTSMGARWMPNGDYAQTRLWYSQSFVGALLSFEHSGFQIGAGPLWQHTEWQLRDSVVPFSTGGGSTFKDTTWSGKSPVGVVGDARYTVLVTSHTFLTLRAQTRRVRRATIPATSRFPVAIVDQGSSFFGFMLGVVW